jgi:hypothetical protein
MSAILIYTQYVQVIFIIVIMLTHARTHTLLQEGKKKWYIYMQ